MSAEPTSYPDFSELKDATDYDLEEIFPPKDYNDEKELAHELVAWIQRLYENDLAQFGYHQAIMYCIKHSYLRLMVILYKEMIRPVKLEKSHPYSVSLLNDEAISPDEELPIYPPTSAFVHYAAENDKIAALQILLDEDMFDKLDMTELLIGKIAGAFDRSFNRSIE